MEAKRPGISDEAVRAKTGMNWKQWFDLLDKAGAAKLEHKGIVALAAKLGGAGPWWRQMVTVEYERARGLRARHEKADGYSISVSKVMPADVTALFAYAAEARRRSKWFPPGVLKISSLTEDKYFRAAWNGTARLEIGFLSRPGGKAQIVVQVNKLTRKSDIESERMAWKKALETLELLLSA